MSHRPRLVIIDPSLSVPAPLRALDEQVDFVTVADVARCVELIGSGLADGLASVETTLGVLTSRQILDRIADGLAVVQADLRVMWCNPAFAALCDGRAPQGNSVYDALGCDEIEGPCFCPFNDCLSGAEQVRTRLHQKGGRHLDLIVQSIPESVSAGKPQLLCIVRDITHEVRQREKLIAIHRAGLELSHLTPEELDDMSTSDRIDLLKANIIQYSQNILDFKNLEIRLLEPRTNRLRVLLSEGMSADAQARDLCADLQGNGMTGFVAATGTSYLCDDVLHDPLYIPGAKDARSSLTVPIIFRERVIGTFNVENPEVGHFNDSDREFLEIFAREIGVTLHTLELLDAEKQSGGAATVEAIVNEVSVPVDEIVADAVRVQDLLQQPGESSFAEALEAVERVLRHARGVKASIRAVERSMATPGRRPAMLESAASLLAGRRVLLTDDDPAIRRSAHQLLGRAGCEVDTAKSGAEALRLCRVVPYDVVVGDIRLPDMNGYEFFEAVRDTRPTTSVVLMTGFGYDASHSIVRARQEGLRAVLYKPFRLDRLCEAIEDALNPKKAIVRPRPAVQKVALPIHP